MTHEPNDASVSDSELAAAIDQANVPTLLMVLVQMTGEMRWLEEPYRPAREGGLDDNDTGGLPPDVQSEIRRASLDAVRAWLNGKPLAISDPDEHVLVRMLSAAMGETIPAEYGPMIREDLANMLAADAAPVSTAGSLEAPRVLIIGAGAGGLCAGVQLKKVGIPFEIVERSGEVGGVWNENRYPGAGVDTPNHLYSFSFAPFDWSRYFAPSGEIKAYLEHVAEVFDLKQHIRFHTSVKVTEYDESSGVWHTTLVDASGHEDVRTTEVVISAVGAFNAPSRPNIPGLDSFAGRVVHTADWPDDLDLRGKRVAMIGNGASAMQTGPAIADEVGHLTVFQRSTQWAAPFEKFKKPIPSSINYLMRVVPLYRAWYRARLGWTFNDRVFSSLQKDPNWEHPDRSINAINDGHRRFFTRYVESELGDRQDLLPKVLPTYPPFGKRMLMDNGWYRMLRKDHVDLVTTGVASVEVDGPVDGDGERHEADVMILATGFNVVRFLSTYEVRGRGGKTLEEAWDGDDARAYLGLAVPDFPNFFTIYGPNTQPGHGGSLLFIIERQVHYLRQILLDMAAGRFETIECRRDAYEAYNEAVDAAHGAMIWTHTGMETYYRNARGRVVVNLPYRNVDFWGMTQEVEYDDFELDRGDHMLVALGSTDVERDEVSTGRGV